MKPGRDLDALVAERVMGWRWFTDEFNPRPILIPPGMPQQCSIPAYSTSIADAWHVVEKVLKYGWFSLTFYEDYPNANVREQSPSGPPYKAHWNVSGCGLSYKNKINADTAPHAICLAALNAMGLLPADHSPDSATIEK